MKKLLIFLFLLSSPTTFAADCLPDPDIPLTLELVSLYPSPLSSEKEWIEIKNTGSEDLDLSNYTLEDSTAKPWTMTGTLESLKTQKIENFSFQLNNGGDSVTLKTINGDFIDSFTYETSSEGQIIYVDSESAVTLSEDTSTTPTFYPIFSEVLPNPEGSDSTEEWIELYNPYSETINLAGLKLDDIEGGSNSYDLEGSMGSENFLLIWIEDSNLSLNNSGDSIRLLGVNDEILWQVDYLDSVEGQSYALINDTYEWTETPTPGEENQASAVIEETENYENGDLSESIDVTEILPNPDGADQDGEWIEITNGSDAGVDLGNWTIDDGEGGSEPYVIPSGTIINPGETLVFNRTETGIALNNSDETVQIVDYNGEVIDEVSYDTSEEGESYAEISVEENSSETASLTEFGTKIFKIWTWTTPTPGEKNPSWKQFKGKVVNFDGSLLTLFDGITNWDLKVGADTLNELLFKKDNQVLVRAALIDGIYEVNYSELVNQAEIQSNWLLNRWDLILLVTLSISWLIYEIYKKYRIKNFLAF